MTAYQRLGLFALVVWCIAHLGPVRAAPPPDAVGEAAPIGGPALSPSDSAQALATAALPRATGQSPLGALGPGDRVRMDVFGRPELGTTLYVGDDGTIRVPLAGPVKVAGLSPVEAAEKVEAAFRQGQYLVNPHVTLTVVQSPNQRVSIIGEVKAPGRYPIEANTTVLDAIAEAGGPTEKGSDVVYLLREDASGHLKRYPINLGGIADPKVSSPAALLTLRGGDRIYVPESQQIYVSGAVHHPSAYRFEPGMTVLQAIARAGGVTDRGSSRRVQIRRLGPKGKYIVVGAKPYDKVQPNDVITVKERIF